MKNIKTFHQFINESKSEEFFGVSLDRLTYILDFDMVDIEEDEDEEKYVKRLYKELVKKSKKKYLNLYRLVWVKKIEDIDKNDLGKYWTDDISVFDDYKVEDHWNMAHNESNEDWEESGLEYENDMWIIKVKTPTTNVDWKQTIITQCEYPTEKEINLKSQDNIKILDIFNVDWENDWEDGVLSPQR